jgi:hypothetical protein
VPHHSKESSEGNLEITWNLWLRKLRHLPLLCWNSYFGTLCRTATGRCVMSPCDNSVPFRVPSVLACIRGLSASDTSAMTLTQCALSACDITCGVVRDRTVTTAFVRKWHEIVLPTTYIYLLRWPIFRIILLHSGLSTYFIIYAVHQANVVYICRLRDLRSHALVSSWPCNNYLGRPAWRMRKSACFTALAGRTVALPSVFRQTHCSWRREVVYTHIRLFVHNNLTCIRSKK